MTNPIPFRFRGWLYIAGVVVGTLVATVVPDVMSAANVGAEWVTVVTRATGALTALLSLLSRANLTDDAAPSAELDEG